jgi:hypothetical protein
MMSVALPGVKGTIMRIDFAGYVDPFAALCAFAPPHEMIVARTNVCAKPAFILSPMRYQPRRIR